MQDYIGVCEDIYEKMTKQSLGYGIKFNSILNYSIILWFPFTCIFFLGLLALGHQGPYSTTIL